MALPLPVPLRDRHPFVTYDMIQEIPAALRASLENTEAAALHPLVEAGPWNAIYLTGCGTAFYAALLGSQLLRFASPPVRYHALEAFELLHYPPPLTESTLVLGISHSGVTKTTLDALLGSRGKTSLRVGITHFPDRPIEAAVDRVVIAGNGPDLSKCHTKCYAAGALAATKLVVELLRSRDGGLPGVLEDAEAQLAVLPDLARELLGRAEAICAGWAEAYRDQEHVVIAGAGPNRPTTLEAALKLKETSFIPADAMETEEVGHGHWVALGPQSLLILIAPQGPSHARSVDLARVARIVGTPVLGLVTAGDDTLAALCDEVLELPDVEEWLSPFLAILPLYLFAYFSSVGRGVNPDELRYLEPTYWEARQVVFPPGTH